jgi:hypothetical protein
MFLIDQLQLIIIIMVIIIMIFGTASMIVFGSFFFDFIEYGNEHIHGFVLRHFLAPLPYDFIGVFLLLNTMEQTAQITSFRTGKRLTFHFVQTNLLLILQWTVQKFN